ncbi:importin subunit alpha-7-like isoform X2 [Centruroides vittatus]|uniref:importin subunit alpha-7-like isoform X2 n=1 Tax=Centruroides vittatus TaxID=120091 RepID=UPI003510A7D8
MSVGRFIQIIEMMNSSNIDVNVLRVIKRNLERGEKYIQAFMSIEGSLHMLKEFLIGPDVEKLLEAIGCCTNLCFSSHEVTVKVINKIAPYLITFLNGNNIIVQEYSSICIGNMAYDCEICCTLLKRQGLLFTIIPLLQSSHQQIVRSCLFVLQNFSRYLNKNDIEKLTKEGILTIISKLLLSKLSSQSLLHDIYNILFHFTAHIESCKQYFHKEAIHLIALNHLKFFCLDQFKNVSIITTIVRILGNLTSSDDTFSTEILSHKYFEDCLSELLTSSFRHIRKEILWLLRNVFASCNRKFIWSNINVPSLINTLLLLHHRDDSANEALYILQDLSDPNPCRSSVL